MTKLTPKQVIENLVDFFMEFDFFPAARFINTLRLHSSTVDDARQYVRNYMQLIDTPYLPDFCEKMKSMEFETLISNLSQLTCGGTINTRLELHFGSQGTGKTSNVQKKYPDAKVIVCNNNIMPADLLETFDFEDKFGNPTFKKSELRIAMEEGLPIIFDEINLLSLDCLRTLQGYLDNKPCISHKNEPIMIKEGFKVIGTMNLNVNGQVFSLPEPLVDRAYDLIEYKPDAETLLKVSLLS